MARLAGACSARGVFDCELCDAPDSARETPPVLVCPTCREVARRIVIPELAHLHYDEWKLVLELIKTFIRKRKEVR